MKSKTFIMLCMAMAGCLLSCQKEDLTTRQDNVSGNSVDSTIDVRTTLTGTQWSAPDLNREEGIYLSFVSDTQVHIRTVNICHLFNHEYPYDNLDIVCDYYYAEGHGSISIDMSGTTYAKEAEEDCYRWDIELTTSREVYGYEDMPDYYMLHISDRGLHLGWMLDRDDDIPGYSPTPGHEPEPAPGQEPVPDVSINSVDGNTYEYYQDFGADGWARFTLQFTGDTFSFSGRSPDGTQTAATGTYTFNNGRGVLYAIEAGSSEYINEFIVTGNCLFLQAFVSNGGTDWLPFVLK